MILKAVGYSRTNNHFDGAIQMKNLTRLLLTASLLVTAGITNAAPPNLLANGSFENTSGSFVGDAQGVMNLDTGSTVIPGWMIGPGVTISWVSNSNPFGIFTPSGDFLLDLTGPFDTGFSSVQQTFATQVGAVYHVSFDMGANNNCPGFDCTGPMATRVVLAGIQKDFTGFDPLGPGMHWETFGLDFTAVAPSTTVSFVGLGAAGASAQFRGFDNASVTAVPEPQIYAMWVAGLGLLGWMTRGRRRRQ